MTDKKKWYQSKGMWAGVLTVLVTLYEGVDAQVGPQIGFDLPNIPTVFYTVMGALGLWGRSSAKKEIE